MNKQFIPQGCHLWIHGNPTKEQLRNDLTTLKVYEKDSHLIRELKKCKTCGQLYFYEFYEWIDWEDGNDPQYRNWIPVQNEGDAGEINALSSIELLGFLRISSSFPSDEDVPRAPQWMNVPQP